MGSFGEQKFSDFRNPKVTTHTPTALSYSYNAAMHFPYLDFTPLLRLGPSPDRLLLVAAPKGMPLHSPRRPWFATAQ